MYVSVILLAIFGAAFASPDSIPTQQDDIQMHSIPRRAHVIPKNARETTASYWNTRAHELIRQKLIAGNNENIAKNVILFLGDGMSIPTLAATRVYIGGEEQQLAFEKFEHTALSKTYCVDAQTADSACSATAYLGGVKNNIFMIGVTANVTRDDCDAMLLEENQVESIAKWSQDVGKRTGIVTTSYVTDASPSGAYAKIANRLWQTDTAVTAAGKNATKCRDITYQLINWNPGKNFNVILGGGSVSFLPSDRQDPLGNQGQRSDGLNLIDEWQTIRQEEGHTAEYVWNTTGLLNIADNTDYLLGLFGAGYMPYNLERNSSLTPSLEQMTEAAIKIVSKGNGAEKGYFLFVEGGRIDHGHHANMARKAFDETVEFSKAIQKAVDMTNEKDTLIVVTSDHAHTMSISGYPDRNNNILGLAQGLAISDAAEPAYLTINYANGPGFVEPGHDWTNDDTEDINYAFPTVVNLSIETHGGDDVGIFARGPWAHLYSGVLEQNTIPHIMAYASCVGNGPTACTWNRSGASQTVAYFGISLSVVTTVFLYML